MITKLEVKDMVDLPTEYSFHHDFVPERIMNSLHQYIKNHLPVGSFLQAVISNDLQKSVAMADKESLANLRAIVMFLYNHAPGSCWGSEAIYKEWIKHQKS